MAAAKIKPSTKLRAQSGQAVIEAAFAATMIIALLTVIFGLLWLGLVKIRIDHDLHEALICHLSHSPLNTFDCEAKLKAKISELPWTPQLQSLQWKKGRDMASVDIQIEARPLKTWNISKLKFSKKLQLPLQEFSKR